MKDLTDRVAKMLTVKDITVVDIHAMLKDEGMSDYEAYLTYIGGKMLYDSRAKLNVGRGNNGPMTAATVPNMKRVVVR